MEDDRHPLIVDLEEAAAFAVAELPRQVSRAVSVIRAHKDVLLQLPCLTATGAADANGRAAMGRRQAPGT